jgi:hypothetical protein
MQRYPFTAATSARPTPVLPAVASMIVPPGRSQPRRSASSTIATPTRSLMLPPGLSDSSFKSMRAGTPCAIRASGTSGVQPIAARTDGVMPRCIRSGGPDGVLGVPEDVTTMNGIPRLWIACEASV